MEKDSDISTTTTQKALYPIPWGWLYEKPNKRIKLGCSLNQDSDISIVIKTFSSQIAICFLLRNNLSFRVLLIVISYLFLTDAVTKVHRRTFAVWTLLNCTLCFLCAFNLENKTLYLVTFLSFIYAFGHFLTEYLFYQTMALSNLTTVGIFACMLFIRKHA
ncbi:probable ergosterol biosynthetic protein 28 [Durio zibethinus]|uniref:Probable ergosterol biosynthetic protein 28 n=1 Tax=Durio zibethinus TaxID=66656 RepID=A0A6P5X714_DURZI|nr:probable ergosterol biosynthetic protein 28 [Durio zibethinus]